MNLPELRLMPTCNNTATYYFYAFFSTKHQESKEKNLKVISLKIDIFLNFIQTLTNLLIFMLTKKKKERKEKEKKRKIKLTIKILFRIIAQPTLF